MAILQEVITEMAFHSGDVQNQIDQLRQINSIHQRLLEFRRPPTPTIPKGKAILPFEEMFENELQPTPTDDITALIDNLLSLERQSLAAEGSALQPVDDVMDEEMARLLQQDLMDMSDFDFDMDIFDQPSTSTGDTIDQPSTSTGGFTKQTCHEPTNRQWYDNDSD